MPQIPNPPVDVVATSNIDIAGGAPDEVDGVQLSSGMRVLLIGQTDAKQNWIYRVKHAGSGSNGTWVRADDANTNGKVRPNSQVWSKKGDDHADMLWYISSDAVRLGSTDIVVERFPETDLQAAKDYADAGDTTTMSTSHAFATVGAADVAVSDAFATLLSFVLDSPGTTIELEGWAWPQSDQFADTITFQLVVGSTVVAEWASVANNDLAVFVQTRAGKLEGLTPGTPYTCYLKWKGSVSGAHAQIKAATTPLYQGAWLRGVRY